MLNRLYTIFVVSHRFIKHLNFKYMNTGTTITNFNQWSEPAFIKVEEVGETIEFIYKQTSMISYTVYPQQPPEERVFKIIYSCKDGRWNKSEPIYGNIIPATDEDYDFD